MVHRTVRANCRQLASKSAEARPAARVGTIGNDLAWLRKTGHLSAACLHPRFASIVLTGSGRQQPSPNCAMVWGIGGAGTASTV